MPRKTLLLTACSLLALAGARADYIQLKDGNRIEGRILAENEDGLEIQVGANEAGTIRRVLIIHSSEISTWAADAEGRVTRKEEKTVTRLAGSDYVKRLLDDAEALIDQRKFDEGVAGFEGAAEIATRHLDDLADEDKVEALKLRAHALRLALAALVGKLDTIKSHAEGLKETMEARKDQWEEARDALEDDKSRAEREERRRRVELGSRRSIDEFEQREEELKIRKERLDRQEEELTGRLRALDELYVQTEAKIELVKERVDRAEDEVKDVERALRRRR